MMKAEGQKENNFIFDGLVKEQQKTTLRGSTVMNTLPPAVPNKMDSNSAAT